ncbi:MAG TPA: hypothetical protein VHA37_01785 [Candidatus Saccharimonadales bacterium]|nr:hypothetical protein [Candidatus Saccharimonadales bacterium]
MRAETKTALYLKYAGRINACLRKCGLLLMAEFEGEPPERPFLVRRIWLQRAHLPDIKRLHDTFNP